MKVILFFTSLGGILLGYCTAINAAALEPVLQHFSLTTFQQGFFTSTILLGALIGALGAGKAADSFGRKPALGISALLIVIGALFSFFATDFTMLILGRFISGLGVGVVSSANPLFLGEIASSKQRTLFVSSHQFAITVGIMLSYFCGYFLDGENWREMFLLSAFPACIQLLILKVLVESPRWLAQQGKIGEAKKAFERLGLGEAERHGLDVPPSMQKLRLPNQPWVWKVLCLGFLLSAFQQLSGINTVIYYAPKIFEEAHFNMGAKAMGATSFIGILNVMATAFALGIIPRLSRRKLLMACYAVMALALALLSSAFKLALPALGEIALFSILAYVVLFAFGPGPITWVVLSEIFPQKIRGIALGGAIFINWSVNYIITLFFLDLVTRVGMWGNFAIFGGLCALAFLFILAFLPETRNKTLEQIEADFSSH